MELRRGAFLKSIGRAKPLFLEIDPHPYLGLAMVILCIFMTAAPPMHPAYAMDLAAAEHGRKIPKIACYDSITISINRYGSIYFRNTKTPPEDLPNRIHDAVLNGAEKRVYLRVDARAKYGDVNALLPYIQLAGIERVTFPVETSRRGT